MSESHSRNKAVGLRYDDQKDAAPRVIAKGEGSIADKIKEVAAQHGIPIRQDNDLVDLLSQVDIDREIPRELYTAVAELLSWIYRTNMNADSQEDAQ